MTIAGGIKVSLWMVLGVALATGLLSGFLGVGGGFIRMPAMFYLIGVPVPVAVGTDLFEIVFSAESVRSSTGWKAVSTSRSSRRCCSGERGLGARIGSAATGIVNEDDIKIYFGLMLLGGSIAVAFQQAGDYLGIEIFNTIGFALILLSAFMVSGAVIYSTISTMRAQTKASVLTSRTDAINAAHQFWSHLIEIVQYSQNPYTDAFPTLR